MTAMLAASRLRNAASHPVATAQKAWLLLRRARLVERYRARANAIGLDRLYLVVSFDCDTEEDIAAAERVHRRMRELGIMPAYAVPGALLEAGASTYRRIAADGAEFLNHGNRRHTYFDAREGRYKSCFFYDEEPRDAVKEDIVAGDRTLRSVIGDTVRGFRTPHFGSFQRPGQLRFMHEILRRLGYRYSSSTAPLFGWCHGPVFNRYGLPEIPVSGGAARPFTIIDSWSCFADPARRLSPQDYEREILGLARLLSGGPGVLNYYADPSHVVDEPAFFSTMATLAQLAEPILPARLVDRRR